MKSQSEINMEKAVSILEPYQRKILDLYKEQELLMASIYQKLALIFPEHSDKYTELVGEEMQHAGWIEELQNACIAGNARFAEGKTRSYTIKSMINYLKKFYTRIQTEQLSEKKAATIVADFENALIERNVFKHFEGDSEQVQKTLNLLQATQELHKLKAENLITLAAN